MHEGDGHPALFDLLEKPAKTLQLLLGMARIVSVAVRQVGHESFDAEGFPSWKGIQKRHQFGRRESETPHPGIHLDMNG